MAKPKSAYSIPGKLGKMDTHIIVVWVDNEAGVLARVVGLFSGRGYNIESLAVAEVDHKKNISRITIVTTGTPQVIEQIKLQLKQDGTIMKSEILDHERMNKMIRRLARKLASKYVTLPKRSRRGALDVRRTLRANMGYGGVPFKILCKRKRIERPKIVAIVDVSRSVAASAQFLLLLL